MLHIRRFLVVLLFALVVFVPLAKAQITTTGIRGFVRDQHAAVVTNATVKVTDHATGIEQSTVSFKRIR